MIATSRHAIIVALFFTGVAAGSGPENPCVTTLAPNPCATTSALTPAPTLAPIPAPTNPCDTTVAPGSAPAPAPAHTPGCDDKPEDWKSLGGSTCVDYVSKSFCTADGAYGSGWKVSDGAFDEWAVNGVAANVACCGCGGGSTVTGERACQGHSHSMDVCEAVGCCRWNILKGCRANDPDAECYSGNPSDIRVETDGNLEDAPRTGHGGAVVAGAIAGAAALAATGAIMAMGTTTVATSTPQIAASVQPTQGAQTTGPGLTTTTKNSSSSLLWLWILLGIIGLCCILALCSGSAVVMGGKKKAKKSRTAKVRQSAPPERMAEPIYDDQLELLPSVPPLLEPSIMMPMASPTLMEFRQAVPMATPTMVETAVPMMQMSAPAALSADPLMVSVFAMQATPSMASPQMMPVITGTQTVGGYGTRAGPRMF